MMRRTLPLLLALLVLSGCGHAARNAALTAALDRLEAEGLVEPVNPEPSHGSRPRVTYIGHATTLIHLDGVSILTDPIWVARLGLSRRYLPPPFPVEAMPQPDLILISHAHFDHLSLRTLRRLPKEISVMTPLHVAGFARAEGFTDVHELSPWGSLTFRGLRITAVPAKHNGARWGIDRFRGYMGYVIEGEQGTVYFAGDTDFFDGLYEIGRRFRIDVALLPIGAYRPQWWLGRKHIDPAEALRAMDALRARYMVPIHWGTYQVSTEPPDEPLWWLRNLVMLQKRHEQVRLLRPGASLPLRAAGPREP